MVIFTKEGTVKKIVVCRVSSQSVDKDGSGDMS